MQTAAANGSLYLEFFKYSHAKHRSLTCTKSLEDESLHNMTSLLQSLRWVKQPLEMAYILSIKHKVDDCTSYNPKEMAVRRGLQSAGVV